MLKEQNKIKTNEQTIFKINKNDDIFLGKSSKIEMKIHWKKTWLN